MNPALTAAPFYGPRTGFTFTVRGNWGTLTADLITGRVIALEEDESDHINYPDEIGYRDIIKLDLAEFFAVYGDDAVHETDILDVGFWALDGRGGVTYCEPEQDWRDDIVASGVADAPGHREVIELGPEVRL